MVQNGNMAKNRKGGQARPSYYRWFLLPVLLMVAVVPLIVRMHTFDNHLTDYAWVSEQERDTVDFFNYYKSILIIILSSVMTAVIVVALFVKRSLFIFSKALVPLCIYAAFVVLSALVSAYPYFVMHGIREQFESVWVLLSYAIMAYYTFLFVREEKDIELVLRFILIGAAVIAILGVFQFAHLDFFRSMVGKKMITPSSYWDYVDGLEFTFDPGRVYVTLYNPNYVGMYVALLLPTIAALIFTRKSKMAWIPYIGLAAGLIICLVGSAAKNGYISIVAAGIFMILLYRKYVLKEKLYGIVVGGSVLILAVLFVLGNYLTNNALVNGIKGVFYHDTAKQALTQIAGTEDDITLTYNGNELHVQLITEDGGAYIISTDKDGKPLTTEQSEDGLLNITDAGYEGVGLFYTQVEGGEDGSLDVCGIHIENGDGVDDISDYWYFSNQVDGSGKYYYYNLTGKFTDITPAESVLFTDNPNLFSGRGFIWAKTIPLLKDYILAGAGPDTFEIAFPQNDYLGMKQNGYGTAVITKPHNMFLQIGVNTGVFSLLAYLAFFLFYAVGALKHIWKKKPETYLEHINAGILAGTFGYMVSGIINDSTVTLAPVFWCMMGVGMSINYTLQRKKNESKKAVEV